MPVPNAAVTLNAVCSNASKARLCHANLIKHGEHAHPISAWNSVMFLYVKNRSLQDACRLFEKMRHRNIFSWNIMISAHAREGFMHKSRSLFQQMPQRDSISWNSMISGYARSGMYHDSLLFFRKMSEEGFIWTQRTFASVIGVCSELPDLKQGIQVHALVIICGTGLNPILNNALIDMYAKCGRMEDARKVFDSMTEQDAFSWTSMIAGYALRGCFEQAQYALAEMDRAGIKVNEVTFASYLNACAEYGRMDWAGKVLRSVHEPTILLWNAMLSGFLMNDQPCEAIKLFCEMHRNCMKFNRVSLLGAIGATTVLIALDFGKQLHSLTVKLGFLGDVRVSSALINMYIRCGIVFDAEQQFWNLHAPNSVSLTSMIIGYAQNGYCEKAIRLFSKMQASGMEADAVTFNALLNACARLAGLEIGRQTHAHVLKKGFEGNVFVRTSLIDMYAKSGSIDSAFEVFYQIPDKHITLWNAMISGYAQHGCADKAINLYNQMVSKGIQPDGITMSAVLCACNHAGLIEKGYQYFQSMSSYNIAPKLEHYVYMINLLGRSGNVQEAEMLIESANFTPDASMLGALLGSCNIHSKYEIGYH